MCEAILWKELKGKQMMGFNFDRQRPIDNYIVDFYCKDLMLAIEVDGSTHYTEQEVERDKIRQQNLKKIGVRFLRFDDDDVKTNINGVLDIIRDWIKSHPELVGRIESESHPPPDPSQEGSLERSNEKSPLLGGDLGLPAAQAGMGTPRRKKDKQFHFKQFSVRHDRSGMKVGTDAVLLGAWVNVAKAKRILDLGTGTGVIALMLAQRTKPSVQIEAVEIDKYAFEDASENFSNSPWHGRLTAHYSPAQNFASPDKFDLIVSNPPYFQNSFKPPDTQRTAARHTESLSFLDLLQTAKRFISEKGALNVVLPYTEGIQFILLASQQGFHCSKQWSFRSREQKPVERLLLEFLKKKTDARTGELILYKASMSEVWSEDYCKLTKEFYLKL